MTELGFTSTLAPQLERYKFIHNLTCIPKDAHGPRVPHEVGGHRRLHCPYAPLSISVIFDVRGPLRPNPATTYRPSSLSARPMISPPKKLKASTHRLRSCTHF
ncbi:hypothetical protein BDR06DRAFT_956400 [Suillus hirtellus]|nr:hypothetical protein BDR06DRAFT_956400 [Suillus hirtellus]